jgi:CO/xanthine dehydrogenase FAD-binding subunit
MKPAPFEYVRPETLAEACSILSLDENARVIAGGQTLVPMMAMRLARPNTLVDISRIEELNGIIVEKDYVTIGAATRQVVVEYSSKINDTLPLLAKAIRWVGHPPTRNRGTVGGSIANADPSAEISLVLATLNGNVHVVGKGDSETIVASDLFIGPMLTTIPDGSILTEVRFPIWSDSKIGTGFHEISARSSDFAFAAAAAQVAIDDKGRCTRATLGIGAVADFPEAHDVNDLIGQIPDEARLRKVVADIIGNLESFDDLHASAAYRLRSAGELAFRALHDAFMDAAND